MSSRTTRIVKKAASAVKEVKSRAGSRKVKKEEEDEEFATTKVEQDVDENTSDRPKKTAVPRKRVKKDEPFSEPAALAELRCTTGQKVLRASEGSSKYLGFHASIAGAVAHSVHDARSLGSRAFALFVRNQRQWASKPMEESAVEAWNRTIEETGFPLEMIVPHGSYLLNPGSPDEEKLKKSRDAMLDECTRAERLGITLYNFHPGSTTGVGTRDECISIIAETMDYVLERTKNIILVVETMAGQGHTVGGTFEEVRAILDAVKGDSTRVGVCIDTCHIFAAGYDIRTRETYDETMSQFDRIVGFDRLRAVHLNDSKSALGSHLDRHERIGKGQIGVDTFRFIMNDSRFNNMPLILETPEGDYANEMILLYGLEEKKGNKGKRVKKEDSE